ncbi:MAG: FAD-binding protein [Anaerolineae bacterium]|jgi:6-methylpretetramide 4-monooxygenase / 4-hydroxy-6-methylpretetramide 12a-monooxygenase|nr:FAD-binding protein [Anaerolineae bacterium]MBT7189135.1 FAD-binding protein [Anaerolineae bacterium]MBT7988555.1 FAD-binding protein [Anaerolineae bacterium]
MLTTTTPDVLIIGAGPAGLTAAAEAIRHGLTVRIIDQNESRTLFSKALVVHSRSLEIFQDMGFADDVVNNGKKFRSLNIHTGNKELSRIVFQELNWKDAVFPYWLSIPQSETERCMEDHLSDLGGIVERNTELVDLEQFPDYVRVSLKHQDNSIERVDVPWVVGCDGARSKTRNLLGLELEGKADDEVFILGDVIFDWDLPEDEGHNILSTDGIVLIVPLPEKGRFRLIFHMPELSVTEEPEITLELLQNLINQRTAFNAQISDLTWSSTFTSKHFVVSEHRQRRVFMAGDAAHIHSPVGGQGLNSGIQDAYNLMWKLALLHHGQALPELLDSYTVERHKTAQDLITRVGTATKIVTLKNAIGLQLRNQLASILLNTDKMQNRMGRDIAMLDIEYENSPVVVQDLLSQSKVDQILNKFKYVLDQKKHDFHQGPSAGMRVPNIMLPANDSTQTSNLHDLYQGTHYTLMLFSGVTNAPDMDTLLEISATVQSQYQASIQPYIITVDPQSDLDGNQHIIVDADKSIHELYAAWQSCLYLIRPDKYIAYRSQTINQKQLTAYLDRILVRKVAN